MKKVTTIIITLMLSTVAMSQTAKKDSATKAPLSITTGDTVAITPAAKFVKINGRVYNTLAFKVWAVFQPEEVWQLILESLISGKQPDYTAQQMSDHIAIINMLQQSIPPKKK